MEETKLAPLDEEFEFCSDSDADRHAIDIQNDMGYYDDITGRYVPYVFPNNEY